MGYNIEIFKKVYDKYTNGYITAREKAIDRTRELYLNIPELVDIDKKLSKVGLEIFASAIDSKEDFKEKFNEVKENNLKLQEKRKELLIENGYPKDYDEVKYECEKCNDTGYIGTKMCSCMKKALIEKTAEHSGIGNLIKTQTFDNFSLEYFKKPDDLKLMKLNYNKVLEYANNFNESTKQNLLFIGKTGLGKTHLSSAIAGKVIEKGFSVLYVSAIDLINAFEFEKFKNDKNDASKTDEYYSCDLLIIDDLGTELINQFSISVIYNVLNVRIANSRPMIINTNLSGKELNTTYQDRIVSRLIGEFEVIQFSGEDIRRKKIGL